MKNPGHVLKRSSRHYSITKKTADITKAFCSKEKFTHKYQIAGLVSESKPVDWPKDLRKDDYYIIEEGITELLVGSQQQPAKELAEYMGIEIIGNNDSLLLGPLESTFYFTKHKLAIECDEDDLKEKDINNEIRR